VEEDLLDHSPAAGVRRPRIDYESHATGLDRNEVGAFLVAAGLGSAMEHALISLLALNGLRVSEATGADMARPPARRGRRQHRARSGDLDVDLPPGMLWHPAAKLIEAAQSISTRTDIRGWTERE
jgi:integrase